MPNNCVVAEKLTDTVLRTVLGANGINYSGGTIYREETWSPACAPARGPPPPAAALRSPQQQSRARPPLRASRLEFGSEALA